MIKKSKLIFGFLFMVMVVGISLGTFHLYAKESIKGSGGSVYSIGDNGEAIMVRGREETVGDYGDVVGYEVTSAAGTEYIEYRDSIHHSMTVTTGEGVTEGYCMQPYVNGPSINAYEDYNYEEGLNNSTIFSYLSEDEIGRWISEYVVSTRYSYGGYMADPNYIYGSNVQDGGTFGTYIIERDGKQEVVKGLMIGGKVYRMSKDEARALTQTIVHYVGNRYSQYNITDFKGYNHPGETSSAFYHLKAYADNSGKKYDKEKSIQNTLQAYDNNESMKPYQSINWQIYDYVSEQWVDYNGESISKNNINNDAIRIKATYHSKNMCNKLVVNSGVENTSVRYSYSPFVVAELDDEAKYYDYFTITNFTNVPITVTYDMLESGKEIVKNSLVNNMTYEIDTFSQTAYIDVKLEDMLKNGNVLSISASTGVGSAAGDCYDLSTGKYGARFFSSKDIQDCLLLSSNKDISLNSDVTINVNLTGQINLKKISGRTDITDNNPSYNMSGAIYNVYAVSSDKDQSKSNVVGTFTTNEDGQGIVTYSKYNEESEALDANEDSKTLLNHLPFGWYMICEEKAPSNGSYKIDDKRYYVYISVDNCDEVITVESMEEINADPVPFEIVKQCSEGENVGAATLEGAEFTVWYYKGEYNSIDEIEASGVPYDRKWILATEIAATTNNATCILHKDLLLEGSSEPYLNDDGDMFLPLGTIVVAETKAPTGYKLDGATYSLVDTIDGTVTPLEGPFISKVRVEQGTVKLSVGNNILIDEEPIRGDFKIIKKDKYTQAPMIGIPFSVTSDTTGESHIIVTDENGIASTSSKFILHSENTNGNDEYNPEAALTPTGIWFSGNSSKGEPNDSEGALPYDTYTVKELPCVANKDYHLAKEFKITISEDGIEYDYGEIINIHKPEIGTEAFDAIDMDKTVLIGGGVSVIDKVSYEYLETDKTYILKGIIINKTTGEQILNDEISVESIVEFTPEAGNGVIEVPFEFELVCCKGDKIVVYEYLYEKESGELVASHEDINCDKQTLTIEATGVKNDIKPPEKAMSIVDTPKTGDDVNIMAIVLMMAISLVGGIAFTWLRKKLVNK